MSMQQIRKVTDALYRKIDGNGFVFSLTRTEWERRCFDIKLRGFLFGKRFYQLLTRRLFE